eukprot:scpid72538/ scgid0883/ 
MFKSTSCRVQTHNALQSINSNSDACLKKLQHRSIIKGRGNSLKKKKQSHQTLPKSYMKVMVTCTNEREGKALLHSRSKRRQGAPTPQKQEKARCSYTPEARETKHMKTTDIGSYLHQLLISYVPRVSTVNHQGACIKKQSGGASQPAIEMHMPLVIAEMLCCTSTLSILKLFFSFFSYRTTLSDIM